MTYSDKILIALQHGHTVKYHHYTSGKSVKYRLYIDEIDGVTYKTSAQSVAKAHKVLDTIVEGIKWDE